MPEAPRAVRAAHIGRWQHPSCGPVSVPRIRPCARNEGGAAANLPVFRTAPRSRSAGEGFEAGVPLAPRFPEDFVEVPRSSVARQDRDKESRRSGPDDAASRAGKRKPDARASPPRLKPIPETEPSPPASGTPARTDAALPNRQGERAAALAHAPAITHIR